MGIDQKPLKAIRIRISLLFFFFGFTFASWASRIPAIQQQLHLSDSGLGAVLLSMPVGSFLALPFSGYLSSKFGSRKITIISTFIYALLLAAIGFSQNTFQITIYLFLFGAAGNIVNIAINTQALALESLYNKTIISSFHGMWSVAGLVAASLGTYFIARSFPVSSHFLLIAIISMVCFLLCAPYLIHESVGPKENRPFFTKPDKALIGLGIIGFCSMICQGAMFDWSGVYFKKVVVAQKTFIGFGYTAFMISMTLVRFITDWLTHRIGFKKIMILCGISTTAGLLIAVLFPFVLPATIGLFLVGVGVSPAVPLVFSAAGKIKILPAPVAIAAVSSIAMIGLLIGPPFIGFISGLSSLKVSFLVLSFFGIAIVVTAFAGRWQH